MKRLPSLVLPAMVLAIRAQCLLLHPMMPGPTPSFYQNSSTNTGATSGAAATSTLATLTVSAGHPVFIVAGDSVKADTITVAYSSGTATITTPVQIDFVNPNDSNNSCGGLWVCQVLTGGSLVISATPTSGSATTACVAQEDIGISSLVPEAHTSTTASASGGVLTSGSLTTVRPDLFVGWGVWGASTGGSAGSGYSNYLAKAQGTSVQCAIEMLAQSSPGTQAGTFTYASLTAWRTGVAAFVPVRSDNLLLGAGL